jgi:hypothetical protein
VTKTQGQKRQTPNDVPAPKKKAARHKPSAADATAESDNDLERDLEAMMEEGTADNAHAPMDVDAKGILLLFVSWL